MRPSVCTSVRARARADGDRPNQDFPWQAAIKLELESWSPDNLPKEFRLRRTRHAFARPGLRRRHWRQLAIGAALLLVIGGHLTPSPQAMPVTPPRLAPGPAGVSGDWGTPGSRRTPAAVPPATVPSGSSQGARQPSPAAQP